MNRIITSLKENLSSVSKVALIVLLCALSGLVISFPLWKLASTFPVAYTVIALTLISVIVASYLFRYFSKISTKKRIRVILRLLAIIVCFSGSILLILNQMRILGILALLLLPALLFIINMALYEKESV
ncbi:MAG: hypothetical protein IJL70_02495 [Treponema sp.]|nr:hypothetical protein [Treponema sp.]